MMQLTPVFPPTKPCPVVLLVHSSHKPALYPHIIYGFENPVAFLLKSAWWLLQHRFSLQAWPEML